MILGFDREAIEGLMVCCRKLQGRLTCPAEGVTESGLQQLNEMLKPYGIECAALYPTDGKSGAFGLKQRVSFFERRR